MNACRPLLVVLLITLSGCHLPGHGDDLGVPPEPPASRSQRGLLLETESLQLGGDAGRNSWRTIGDGMWGF